jgi:hypothetical protein
VSRIGYQVWGLDPIDSRIFLSRITFKRDFGLSETLSFAFYPYLYPITVANRDFALSGTVRLKKFDCVLSLVTITRWDVNRYLPKLRPLDLLVRKREISAIDCSLTDFKLMSVSHSTSTLMRAVKLPLKTSLQT